LKVGGFREMGILKEKTWLIPWGEPNR
jgi:hypothetical protein